MATAQQNTKTFDAKRFAALLAGFDLGNASEEEAMSKGRVMRRMAAQANMRIVDLLELPDVRKAIDDQMQPRREAAPDLREAMEQATALREELTERTRDVRKLAETLKIYEQAIEKWREESDSDNWRSWALVGMVLLLSLEMFWTCFVSR